MFMWRAVVVGRGRRGRRCWEGDQGNCNSLWMGWPGLGGKLLKLQTFINLPSGPDMLEPHVALSLSHCVRRDLVQLCGDRTAQPDKLWSVQIITALTPFSVTQQSLATEHRVLTGSLRQFSYTHTHTCTHTHTHNES